MKHHSILRVVSKFLIPFILIYALYVQFHGEFSPGGGFQAGAFFACAMMLYGLIYGLKQADKVVPMNVLNFLQPFGAFIYLMVGVVCLLLGGNFLDYDFLPIGDPVEDSGSRQIWGIVLVEIGVGVAVFAVMLGIFHTFTSREP